MTATSTGGGQYLDMGDAPSIPLLGQLVQERMDHIGRPKWATTAARTAAYAAPGAQAPIVGDESYLADVDQNQRFNGTSWRPMLNSVGGSYAANNGAGFVVINHGLGRTPVAVTASQGIGDLEGILVVITGLFTSTQFTAKFYRNDGPGALGGFIRFSWIAV